MRIDEDLGDKDRIQGEDSLGIYEKYLDTYIVRYLYPSYGIHETLPNPSAYDHRDPRAVPRSIRGLHMDVGRSEGHEIRRRHGIGANK